MNVAFGLPYSRKHPHVRGEDAQDILKAAYSTETPPRTWGRQAANISKKLQGRNTPTYVGKTETHDTALADVEKHPHVRGEDTGHTVYSRSHTETPPRTWGRQTYNRQVLLHHGNTPTYVGKTARTSMRCSISMETPPRTWGRRGSHADHAQVCGNTPTYVGKTLQTFDDALDS